MDMRFSTNFLHKWWTISMKNLSQKYKKRTKKLFRFNFLLICKLIRLMINQRRRERPLGVRDRLFSKRGGKRSVMEIYASKNCMCTPPCMSRLQVYICMWNLRLLWISSYFQEGASAISIPPETTSLMPELTNQQSPRSTNSCKQKVLYWRW